MPCIEIIGGFSANLRFTKSICIRAICYLSVPYRSSAAKSPLQVGGYKKKEQVIKNISSVSSCQRPCPSKLGHKLEGHGLTVSHARALLIE
jgi:hypothetical protein